MKNSQKTNIKIQRIVPKKYSHNQIRLQTFLVAVIHKKYTNEIIKHIRQLKIQSNIEKSFLKRVNKYSDTIKQKAYENQGDKASIQFVRIILCQPQQEGQIKEFLNQYKEIIKQVIQQKIPGNPPLNREQLKQWSKFWPVNLIEPQCVKEISHSQEQIQFMTHMIEKIEYENMEENNQKKKHTNIVLFDSTSNQMLISKSGQCKKGSMNHPVLDLLQDWPVNQKFLLKKDTKQQYYYLTGLRILLLKQICGMCKMALVHSRIQRVYLPEGVFEDNPDYIFWQPALNHKINMFRIQKVT